MVRKLFRAGIWGIEGVLLLVAVGALFAWPCSIWHAGAIFAKAYEAESNSIKFSTFSTSWARGRMVVGHGFHVWIDGGIEYDQNRNRAKDRGSGWTIEQHLGERFFFEPEKWGPIGWWQQQSNDRFSSVDQWEFSFPLGLLALATSLWPLTSLALFIRRRRRLRNLRRSGCCLHCGYDLRAASSDPAARCPECGTVRPAVV